MANWEPTATKLPIYGQRGVSSDDWKYIINEIYIHLNSLKINNFGNTEPIADVGQLWYDNKITEHRLKVKTPNGWLALLMEGNFGTAAYQQVGTNTGNVVGVLEGSKLPILNGSNITNVNAAL